MENTTKRTVGVVEVVGGLRIFTPMRERTMHRIVTPQRNAAIIPKTVRHEPRKNANLHTMNFHEIIGS